MWIKIGNKLINTDRVNHIEIFQENTSPVQANVRIWWNNNHFLDVRSENIADDLFVPLMNKDQ